MAHHHWITAARRAERQRLEAGLDLPPLLARVDAHRRLRGPYTAAGSVLRAIGADARERCPELLLRHHIEILTAAPEFAGVVPPIPATLAQQAQVGVRTRYHARLHTLRVAHGLTEFLRDYTATLDRRPRTVVIENLHRADPTDQEFVAVLLRRLEPGQLTVVVATDGGPLTESPGPVNISLPEALRDRTVRISAAAVVAAPPPGGPVEVADLSRAYVAAECLSDDPRELAAYEATPAADRAALHDERRRALLARDEPSLLLGAIPFHAERAGRPADEIGAMLRAAQHYCKDRGLYHAAAYLGHRGRSIVDRTTHPELWWDLTGDVTTSLSAAGRAAEAEELYDEIRSISLDPAVHMHAAYGTAMLFARHYGDERRDAEHARRWLNQAVAIASLLPDPKERAFQSVFQRNGIALVEVRQGRTDEALRLLNDGMARLDRELAPGEQIAHRIGLRYNRAQVYGISGHLEEALADYTAVLEIDPNFPDHYFNRGAILRRLGRIPEAIEDFGQALRLSPPFAEAYYNRGEARIEAGDRQGALADLDRVLELDPDHVDARLNRAALRCDLDDLPGAGADLTAGLAVDPGNAHLLSLHARVLGDRGEVDAALAAVTAALHADRDLAEAWAIRGGLHYLAGDRPAAIADLSHAVRLHDTPEIRYNRATAYRDAGRFAEAAADYRAVLAVTDDADAAAGLDRCVAAGADRIAACGARP